MKVRAIISIIAINFIALTSTAFAKDVDYIGNEVTIEVNPKEPVLLTFPGKIDGGFKIKKDLVRLERKENNLIVFLHPNLPEKGIVLIVVLEDSRSYSIRLKHSAEKTPRDSTFRIIDKANQTSDDFNVVTSSLKEEIALVKKLVIENAEMLGILSLEVNKLYKSSVNPDDKNKNRLDVLLEDFRKLKVNAQKSAHLARETHESHNKLADKTTTIFQESIGRLEELNEEVNALHKKLHSGKFAEK